MRILIGFYISCFWFSSLIYGQGIILKSCQLESDPIACSNEIILNRLSKGYNVDLDDYFGVRITFGQHGNIEDYMHLMGGGNYDLLNVEIVDDIIKSTLSEIDEKCNNRSYDLIFYIDSQSNFHFDDDHPPYPIIGYKNFNKVLNNLFQTPDTVFGYSSEVDIIMNFEIDSLGFMIEGSGRIVNMDRVDYRLQEAGMDLLEKLYTEKWIPKYEKNKAISCEYRITYRKTVNMIPSGELLNAYKTQMGPYFDRGVKLLKDNKLDLSIEQFGKALYIDPDNVDALYNRGAAYYMKNDLENACLDWDKAKNHGDIISSDLVESKCR